MAPPDARAAPSLAADGERSGRHGAADGASGYGFDAVERLPGNVAYVRMSYFADFDRTAAKPPPARRAGEAARR